MLLLKAFSDGLNDLNDSEISTKHWDIFSKGLALAFLAYWLHLSQGLNDWLGSGGFHLVWPTTSFFAPLPPPWALILWWTVLAGDFLMFSRRTLGPGCLIAGLGFFYATMCDPASVGALNMHFLFAFAVIFWGSRLSRLSGPTMSAWPVYLMRIYLVVVYFGAGWRKAIYGNWLSDSDTLLHCMSGFYTSNLMRYLYPRMPLFTWTSFQFASIAFELAAPLLLLYPPCRKWGILMGCLMHIGIALLMKGLFYFSWLMITFYIPILIPIARGRESGERNSLSPRNSVGA